MADVEIALLEKKSEALEKKNSQSPTKGTPSVLQEEEQMDRALGVAKKKRTILLAQPPVIEKAYAVAEGKPGHAKIQKRGDPSTLGEEVPRHFLKVLGGQALPKEETGSGRRELAEWLTAPGNPLTARVMVNRIWQHHFGKGLVSTPSDFGARGLPPTHPELLDFLAQRFVESGWSIKAMHKFIMLSQTYQQASADSVAGLTMDPNNEWHWKFERHTASFSNAIAHAVREENMVPVAR